MSAIDYPYSQGDRLEERNTYFYSQYHGAAFFPVWQASRQAALAHLPPAQALPLPTAGKQLESAQDTAALLADRPAGCERHRAGLRREADARG